MLLQLQASYLATFFNTVDDLSNVEVALQDLRNDCANHLPFDRSLITGYSFRHIVPA